MGKIIPGRVFIGNLDRSVDESTLTSIFSKYGKVKEVEVMKFHDTDDSRGFGFLTFDDPSAAEDAIKNQSGKVFFKKDNPIKISFTYMFYLRFIILIVLINQFLSKNLNGRPIRIAPALMHKDDDNDRGFSKNRKHKDRSPVRRGRRDFSRSPVRKRSSRYSPDYEDDYRDNSNVSGGLNNINEFLMNAASSLMNNNGGMMGPNNPALNMMMMFNKQNQNYSPAVNTNNTLAALQSMMMSNNVNPSTLTPSSLMALINNMGSNNAFGGANSMSNTNMLANTGMGSNNLNNTLMGLLSQLTNMPNTQTNNSLPTNKYLSIQQQQSNVPNMGMGNGQGNSMVEAFLGSASLPPSGNSSVYNNSMMANACEPALGMRTKRGTTESLSDNFNMIEGFDKGQQMMGNNYVSSINKSSQNFSNNVNPNVLPDVSSVMNAGSNNSFGLDSSFFNMMSESLMTNSQFPLGGNGMLGAVPDASFRNNLVGQGGGGEMRYNNDDFDYNSFEYRKRGGAGSDYGFGDYEERKRSNDRPLHRRR